jgi:hypothetical protein
MSRSIGLILVCVLFFVATAARANVIVWQLDNVVFDDDATATGTFTLDDNFPGLMSAVDIKVSGSANFPAFHFTGLPPDVRGTQILFDVGTSRGLHMTFQHPIANSGSSQIVFEGSPNPIDFTNFQNFDCIIQPGNTCLFRHIVSGQIIAVPEPEAYALLAAGILLLLAKRRARFRQ